MRALSNDEDSSPVTRRLALTMPALLAPALATPAFAAGASRPRRGDRSPGPGTTIHGLDDLPWRPAPGAPPKSFETADVVGSFLFPGTYVTYARWYPGWMSAPHCYAVDRTAVMVSGIWSLGAGRTLDVHQTLPMYPGETSVRQAFTPHYDGVLPGNYEPAVFVLFGVGPAIPIPVDLSAPLYVEL